MLDRLKIKTALLLALLLTLLISGSAAATVQYETVTAPRVRSGQVSALGSVLVRLQPLFDMEHAAWVSLPDGFKVEEVSVTRADYNKTPLEFELHGLPGPAPVTAEPGTDGFLFSIPAQGEISAEVLVIFSFDRVEVPSDYRGPITVNFEGLQGQFTGGSADSALVPGRPVEDPDEVDEPEEPEPPLEPDPDEPEPPVEVPARQEVLLVVGSRTVHLDSRRLRMDVEPFIEEGRTFVPVRFVAEAFGAEADWSPKDGPVEVVTLKKNGLQVTMRIGSPLIEVRENGALRSVSAEVPPRITNGRTFLPFRAVGEIFGAEFDWGPKDALTEWVRFQM